MPVGYSLNLTTECNLRCGMCFEWGSHGWYRRMQDSGEYKKEELSWDIAERLVRETASAKPFYLLWGGEPLLYSHFKELIALTGSLHCFSYVSTNGIMLDRYFPEIKENQYLTFLISIDGKKDEHDAVRGKGTFDKIMDNITGLKAFGRKSPYVGAELTILPHNVNSLEGFCDEMQSKGVDWIALNMCWFISTPQKESYEKYMKDFLCANAVSHLAYLNDNFQIDRKALKEQFAAIKNKKYSIPVLWQPPFNHPEYIDTYLDHPETPLSYPFCYKQWLQADINYDGKVVSCKDWPDYLIGDLHRDSMRQIWNSENYKRFRAAIGANLMPVCSKCSSLGLYSI